MMRRMNDVHGGETHRLTVGPEDAGTRIDRLLATGPLSRSRIKALIEGGALSVDGTVCRDPSASARAGSTLVLIEPPSRPATPAAQEIPLSILFEDEHLVVLDKPAGLVVHPAPGNEDHTLVNALLAHCGDGLSGIGGEKRPGIVHRLDKDTSGVMVVAKTQSTHEALSRAFAERDLTRSYLAIAWGLPATEGEFDGAIGRDKRDRKRMAVTANGKASRTGWRVLEAFGAQACLVRCRLMTGRTHQIRVHFSHAGHPLMGDPLYLRRIPAAARDLAPDARVAALDFARQALHAEHLGFRHPATGEDLRFDAPPPEDFTQLADVLRAGAAHGKS